MFIINLPLSGTASPALPAAIHRLTGISTSQPNDPGEHALHQHLEACLNRPVSLVLTENSTSMLSARLRDGVLRVRLHRMFVNAGSPVFDEIIAFLTYKRVRMPLFHTFVREHRVHLRTRTPRKFSSQTAGKFHDLRELYREINEQYFEGRISAAITWGSKSPRSAVRKRTLGSFSERSNIVRINPVLDRKTVPRYYIAFVVYHEMLHAAMGTSLQGTRRSVHAREFRKRERLFADYQRAVAFERV